MPETPQLDHPHLIAVWPGMGQVALGAGYYLMSKLGMQQFAELRTEGVFDVDAAIVNNGIVQRPEHPHNRLFFWRAPPGSRDVIVFIGEAQPPLGKFAFCEQLIGFARSQGVERVYTFAAMATEMSPGDDARVFAAATDAALLEELGQTDIEVLREGQVSGLNGILLAAAVTHGMPGICLLGEMPHLFTQMMYPKASLAVLRVFTRAAGIELDLAELAAHAEATEHRLTELLAELRRRMQGEEAGDESELASEQWKTAGSLSEPDEARIEALFAAAEADRSRAYELKSELDRLGVFADYEDRFLDLFK